MPQQVCCRWDFFPSVSHDKRASLIPGLPVSPLGIITAPVRIPVSIAANPRKLKHLKQLVTPLRSHTRRHRQGSTAFSSLGNEHVDLDNAVETAGIPEEGDLLEAQLTQAFGQGIDTEVDNSDQELTSTFGHAELPLRYQSFPADGTCRSLPLCAGGQRS